MPAVARRRNAARLLWIAALGLSALGVAIAGRRIALLLRPTGSPEPTPGSALPFETMDAMFVEHRVVTLVHVVSGLRFVVLGPLQFHRGLRSRPPRWHRVSGRIFLVATAVIGVTGLIVSLTVPAVGGVTQASATGVAAIAFLPALGTAFDHVLSGDLARHREWMIRGFALELAVSTIRPIVGAFFATASATGLAPAQYFGPAFWLGIAAHAGAAK